MKRMDIDHSVRPAGSTCSAPASPLDTNASCSMGYLLAEKQIGYNKDGHIRQIHSAEESHIPFRYETAYPARMGNSLSCNENMNCPNEDIFNRSFVNNVFSPLGSLTKGNSYQYTIDNIINYANEIKSRDVRLCMNSGTLDAWNESAESQDVLVFPHSSVIEDYREVDVYGCSETEATKSSTATEKQNNSEKSQSDCLVSSPMFTHQEADLTVCMACNEIGLKNHVDSIVKDKSIEDSDSDTECEPLFPNYSDMKSVEDECDPDCEERMGTQKNQHKHSSESDEHCPESEPNVITTATDNDKVTSDKPISCFKKGNKSSSLFFQSSMFGSGIILGSNEKIQHDMTRRYDLLRPPAACNKPWESSRGEKKSNYLKNLIVMGIGYMFAFIAVGSVNNLQSSLNHEGGVGLLSMATFFVGWTLFSMVSPPIVLKFNPKLCMIVGFVIQTFYILSNLYPESYMLITMSALLGMAMAVIWNAMSTYVITLSKYQASKDGVLSEHVSGKFYGIFFLFFQLAFVIGNLVTSMVLLYVGPKQATGPSDTFIDNVGSQLNNTGQESMFYNVSSNMTDGNAPVFHYHLCGSKYCHSHEIDHASMHIAQETKYVLFGFYFACSVVAIFTLGFFMESFTPFNVPSVDCRYTMDQVKRTCKLMVGKWYLAVLPINIFASLQHGFAMSELTKAFVTCPLGMGMVGYLMAFLAFCSSVSSFSSGCIGKYVGRVAIIISASVVDLGCILAMFLWQPTPSSLYPFFLLFGAWGLAHGIWHSVISTLMAILFENRIEESYACLRFTQGITLAVSYFYAQHLCMETKLYILLGTCVFGVITYSITEHFLKKWKLSQLETDIQT